MLRATLLLCQAIIRDQRLRRLCMFWLVGAAVIMLFLGAALIPDRWGREHPWLYMAYWAACIWLTATGVLLAFFDILVIRATARATRRRLEKELASERLKGEGQ